MADPTFPATSAAPSSTASRTSADMPAALNDAEARILKLESLLADRVKQAEKEAGDRGLIPHAIDKIFGKSWSTSFYGVLAGVGGVAAVVPNLDPKLHAAAGVAAAIGTLMLGLSAKSKNVTGTEKT